MALVDAEELKQTLWGKCDEYDFDDDYHSGVMDGLGKAIKIVDEMPDVSRGKAKWVRNSCSNCGSLGLDHWEYCPLCGCEMESGENDTDRC